METISNMPQDVSASLVSPYDEADLTLTEGPTDSDGTWILEFTVPIVRPGLYDLYINFTGTEYIQERSVWVMTEWPENLTISQISDIHQPYGGKNFTQYIYEQNLLNPDMIFVTGDIVDVETIRSAWENVQGTMRYSTVPIYFQPGNHDYTNGAQY
ncbi:MAG: metallophosphoesterase [archaeon]